MQSSYLHFKALFVPRKVRDSRGREKGNEVITSSSSQSQEDQFRSSGWHLCMKIIHMH